MIKKNPRMERRQAKKRAGERRSGKKTPDMFFISVLIKKLQFLLHTHSQVRAETSRTGCVSSSGLKNGDVIVV